MKLGTPVTTPEGKGTINGVSTRTGCQLYRVEGVNGSPALFRPADRQGR